ncbi:MAG: hypothetical protein ABI743_11450 [bacterium]
MKTLQRWHREFGPGYEMFVGVLLVLAAISWFQQFPKQHEKARETEAKANLREIQVALERYGVDNGGLYPLILYGGDPSDTFATTHAAEVSDFSGDVDWLLQSNYLAEYPRNPFHHWSDHPLTVDPNTVLIRGLHEIVTGDPPQVRPRVNIWALGGTRGDVDRSKQWVPRTVGGPKGDRMWDVSEGQRHIPFPIESVPDDGKNPNPVPGVKQPAFHDDHQNGFTPGNFYYSAFFSGISNYNTFEMSEGGAPQYDQPIAGIVSGYRLAAYGTMTNPGQDVYVIEGDYPGLSFQLDEKKYPPCPDNMYCGPDGRRDGVILVLQSGAERKAAINQDDTGRDFNASS